MRKTRDPRREPMVGDVLKTYLHGEVKVRETVERKAGRGGTVVKFKSSRQGDCSCGMTLWKRWFKHADVLEMAPEGVT